MMDEQQLSEEIENLLVERNLRGMKYLQSELMAGYCLRGAQLLRNVKGNILIGTGFPVENTFETDGPVGAIILYHALNKLGATPILVCGKPMSSSFQSKYRVCEINIGNKEFSSAEAKRMLKHYEPDVVISIERPGLASDGLYYNMRGENISDRVACFDQFLIHASCPTLAIGDGGNEIGMGNVNEFLKALDIIPSVTPCDELIIADVSNWGVYGLLAFLSLWSKQDLLSETCPESILKYLSKRGSVDGVTRQNELTEDSLPASEGKALIVKIRHLIGYS